MGTSSDDEMTVTEVAAALGFQSSQGVRDAIARGDLTPSRRVGLKREYRISRAEVEAYRQRRQARQEESSAT